MLSISVIGKNKELIHSYNIIDSSPQNQSGILLC